MLRGENSRLMGGVRNGGRDFPAKPLWAPIKTAPFRLFTCLAENSRAWNRATREERVKLQLGNTPMLRLALALAIAAPLLSGCIIVSTEKPTTRVVTAPAGQ